MHARACRRLSHTGGHRFCPVTHTHIGAEATPHRAAAALWRTATSAADTVCLESGAPAVHLLRSVPVAITVPNMPGPLPRSPGQSRSPGHRLRMYQRVAGAAQGEKDTLEYRLFFKENGALPPPQPFSPPFPPHPTSAREP